MARILVSGLINLETTLRIERFPLEYFPVTYPIFGVHSSVSGVGYNLARALTRLGDTVNLISLIGSDAAGDLARTRLRADGIDDEFVLSGAPQTAQSVIIYDQDGRRQIHADLKDMQERVYPEGEFARALAPCSLAVLGNINFSRKLLGTARLAGKPVATDVHAIASLDDDHNQDFMREAAILFMSHERLPCPPEEWALAVQAKYHNGIIGIGLGSDGALLAVKDDGFVGRIPAAHVRPVVSTIGAGDALFSAFLHYHQQDGDPYAAIRHAVLFAAYKIGETGAADGFLDEIGLSELERSQGAR